jgi:hypothetical protein
MIAKHEVLPLLLESCPSFAPKWQEFLEEWNEQTSDLQYLALAEYARHLIEMLERDETTDFPAVFAAVERLHVEGDPWVKEAATVGLLESLQNTNLHSTTKPEQFRPFLGPESSRWWDKLYDFWEKGKLLKDD